MRANGQTDRSTREMIREVNALKTQLQKLSTTLEADAGDGVSRALRAIESKSRQAIDDAIEAAQEFVDEYGEGAREGLDALARRSAELREKARESLVDNVRSHPVGTLAAIAGAGFLAGYLARRH